MYIQQKYTNFFTYVDNLSFCTRTQCPMQRRLCYYDHMIKKRDNIPRGHRRFEQIVVPVLVANGWSSQWLNVLGTDHDRDHGIDYLHGKQGIAARIWDGMPKQHFSMRWLNTRYPNVQCELPKMLNLLALGHLMPDYTIEAHTYNGRVYIAIVDTKTLIGTVQRYHPNLPQFVVRNDTHDFTVFAKCHFDLLPPDAITKIIAPIGRPDLR